MALKEALLAEQTRKREAQEAARRPYDAAFALLKGLYREMIEDPEIRTMIRGEIELNEGELQVDPGPILIRATVDQAGDYHLTYEIKRADDPEIRSVEVKTIPDIENAIARLVVDYGVMTPRRIINLEDAELNDFGDGKIFSAKLARLGPILGSTGLGCSLIVLPPSKRAFPFHRHHVIEEAFFVLEGQGETRIGEGAFPIRAGDVIAAPAGTEAHQIINTGHSDLKYLAFSTLGSVDVLDYPDSGKMAVGAGIKNADLSTATYKAMGKITPTGYFDGEEPKS